MERLVKRIIVDYPNGQSMAFYCYGDASSEANLEMQKPLKKLYELERQIEASTSS